MRRVRRRFHLQRVEPSNQSRSDAKHDSLRFVTAASALPDDPDQLKAMLLAERAESERLRQIIKELQRHRFGRRAETLPEDQLLLALEEVEQTKAAGHAQDE
jgi:Transposase C of IS166 homeodomain